MDYKWARDFTLELINQYSIAGGEIATTYNNQADYIRRIPKLLNDAQIYVATNAGKIRTITDMKSKPIFRRLYIRHQSTTINFFQGFSFS